MTLLGIVAILLVVWLFLRRRANAHLERQEKLTPAKVAEDTSFHAVSIKFASDACAAAKAMSGRRILASAAPRLPLPDCNAAQCQCRFVHHKDRRSGHDRRSPFGRGAIGGGTGRFDKERRERSDRRKDADTDRLI